MKIFELFLISLILDFSTEDLIRSPLFEDGPESKALQEIRQDLDLLKEQEEHNALKKTTMTTKEQTARNFDPNFKRVKQILSKFLSKLYHREKRQNSKLTGMGPQWYKWTDWSSCSVTCGKGRIIRWRHCKSDCANLETEMEEIACQLPECPRKLFGLIKLA